MPQFDETSPLNEICDLALEKKKTLNLNKQKKGFGSGVITRYCSGCNYPIFTHHFLSFSFFNF